MYIKDNSVLFTIKLGETASPPGDLDVTYTDPDGVTTYGVAGPAYTPPTSTTKGSLTFSKSFNKAGLWFIQVSSGTSASHTIYSNQAISIVEHDSTFTSTINF